MNVTLPIPDDLAARLGSAADVARRALAAFAAAEHQAGRLTEAELNRLLGFTTTDERDALSSTSEIDPRTRSLSGSRLSLSLPTTRWVASTLSS